MVKRHPRVALGKVDIEHQPKIQGHYSVYTMPMILLTIEEKETLREARSISLNLVEEKLNRYEMLLFDE